MTKLKHITETMQRLSRFSILVLVIVFLLSACASKETKELYPLAAPHIRAFAQLDSWIRRVITAEAGFVDDQAMEETAFASLRSTPHVVGAWIERRSTHRKTLVYPNSSVGAQRPEATKWTSLRFAELSLLQAARIRLNKPAVVLSREGRDTQGEVVRITVAFALD